MKFIPRDNLVAEVTQLGNVFIVVVKAEDRFLDP